MSRQQCWAQASTAYHPPERLVAILTAAVAPASARVTLLGAPDKSALYS